MLGGIKIFMAYIPPTLEALDGAVLGFNIQYFHPVHLAGKAPADKLIHFQAHACPVCLRDTCHIICQYSAGLIAFEMHRPMQRCALKFLFQLPVNFNRIIYIHYLIQTRTSRSYKLKAII